MGPRIYILGYGNPGRQDDGLGPAVSDAVYQFGISNVYTDAGYQLNLEDGAHIAQYDTVVFADASLNGPEPFEWKPLRPGAAITFSSHALGPESVLAVCAEHFGPAPPAWLLGIRGYDFGFGEGLSPEASQNLAEALRFLRSILESWKE